VAEATETPPYNSALQPTQSSSNSMIASLLSTTAEPPVTNPGTDIDYLSTERLTTVTEQLQATKRQLIAAKAHKAALELEAEWKQLAQTLANIQRLKAL